MVKGTQFRVSVNAGKTTVDVVRGQVEVADFKSGQIAQVMAGQHATAFASGKTGLSLGGSGTLAPIEQGKPRAPSIERVPVPRNGSLGASQRGQRTKHPTVPAGERSRRPARCCSHIVADRRSAVKRPPRDERSRSQQFGRTRRRAERHQQGHHLAIAQLVGRRKRRPRQFRRERR